MYGGIIGSPATSGHNFGPFEGMIKLSYAAKNVDFLFNYQHIITTKFTTKSKILQFRNTEQRLTCTTEQYIHLGSDCSTTYR